ncbi:hypothetical protein BC936DRAFT_142823 [Jimgerdemannia flammicorona]|uniref:Uncharacterized protein n=1 Tax=Jimgerdemannia flammicorona TaxID=994334 RepID=A0A433DEQ0_9FUNG|nr:hypothetical protein BC936DRAFT_142823 [Jimgerdemannia flammicorona]
MHDPSTVDVETTIGFGVTRYTDKDEDFWSVLYIRSDGQGNAPVGLFQCSPDRRYAACFSGDDGILTVWRLYLGQDPEFVKHISVPDFTLREFDNVGWLSHKQFSLAVSNTVDEELPDLVLGRRSLSHQTSSGRLSNSFPELQRRRSPSHPPE